MCSGAAGRALPLFAVCPPNHARKKIKMDIFGRIPMPSIRSSGARHRNPRTHHPFAFYAAFLGVEQGYQGARLRQVIGQ